MLVVRQNVDLGVRLVSVITNITKEQLIIGNLTTEQGTASGPSRTAPAFGQPV